MDLDCAFVHRTWLQVGELEGIEQLVVDGLGVDGLNSAGKHLSAVPDDLALELELTSMFDPTWNSTILKYCTFLRLKSPSWDTLTAMTADSWLIECMSRTAGNLSHLLGAII